MDMTTPLTSNDDLILTPSFFSYQENIREACCSLLLSSTPNQTLAVAPLPPHQSRRTQNPMDRTAPVVAVVEAVDAARCNAPNFELNFFLFFSLSLAKIGRYPSFPFLFAKTSPIFKTLGHVTIVNPRVIFFGLLHHAEPCISLIV
jgi:hypothetical protein